MNPTKCSGDLDMIPSREQIMGMTTNERLFESGLMDDFDQAVAQGDTDKVRSVLRSVFVDEASIEIIISNI